ncbi:hypothetical protein L6164_034526 [Bauhinia variegata]|uniref:Uncharacterized protein n=1 Tax=Bauhinia variegata TaxID=167791 RepID=A0ACB9KVU2_BAUVA|nr:hypothetical protein L6164_034526 [Bauhinia variegata]
MEQLSAFQMTVISAALVVISSVNLASGQLSTPCTTSMISTFTPCANFITGSSNNGSTPSSSCCDSLKDLMKSSTACACMVISANVPIPLNRTLALSLPQACNMNGVPLQCQGAKCI